ncbi:MAG TPA: glycosyltransferase family 2 protein [Lachnospiraceae bacterium]|nr:glycosyltransferase family 2 protein [Lachnospiraceae bacterium]
MYRDQGMEEKLLTVFTPTFNRAELLKRAFQSLMRQSCKDFIWLIVDDGSLDDTGETVENFRREADFEIRYYRTENGGKMRAHNMGAKLCDTRLFLCLDSDDLLTGDAVETICEEYRRALKSFEPSDFNGKELAGIVAHKGIDEGTPLYGCDFPKDPDASPGESHKDFYSTLYGLYLRGFKGETTLVYRTELLRMYPFPEIEGEKYVPEDYIYDKIDSDHVLKVVPKVLTVCKLVSGGYTASLRKLKRENPLGWYLYYEQRARITPASLLKIKYSGYYMIYSYRTRRLQRAPGKLSFFWRLSGLMAALILKLTGRE